MAENWSPNQIPTDADTAVITNSGTYTVTVDTNTTVDTIILGGGSGTQTVASASATFVIEENSAVGLRGVLALQGGTFENRGTLTVDGRVEWTAGIWEGAGETVFGADSQLNLDSSTHKVLLTQTLTIGGTARWIRGQWRAGFDSVVNVLPNGMLDVESESGGTVLGGTATLNNEGLLRKGGLTGPGFFNWRVNNNGRVVALTGGLSFNGGGLQTGIFHAGGGITAIGFDGGAHEVVAGADFTGAGLFRITGGVLRFQTALTSDVRWELSGAGALGGTNRVTFTGPFEWRGGRMQESGEVVFGPSSMLTLTGGARKDLRSRKMVIEGTARWTEGQWRAGIGAEVNIRSNGVLEVESEWGATVWAGVMTLNNEGILRKSSGRGNSFLDWSVENRGSVEAQSGTLSFSGGYTQLSGRTVLEGGDIGSDLIDIRDGELRVQVEGLIAGVDYNQLHVDGTANLSGTLHVDLFNGFVPAVGDAFTVMTYTARSGQFSSISSPPGITLQATYLPTELVLTVLPPLHVLIPAGFVGEGTNRAFRICMTGELGQEYEVYAHPEVETPLPQRDFLGLMTPDGNLFEYFDANATNFVKRFLFNTSAVSAFGDSP